MRSRKRCRCASRGPRWGSGAAIICRGIDAIDLDRALGGARVAMAGVPFDPATSV